MFANERQDKIYDILKKHGAVTTSGLVDIFKVSVETVRRDLLYLEKCGKLMRVHGGAVAKSDMKPFLELKQRNKEFAEEKTELSKTAAKFISENDIIAIDSGSTAIYFSEMLKENFKELTVITHSMDVFDILKNHKNFNVILCGGNFMVAENCFYGELTLEMLCNLHVQKAFIFPSAVSFKYGIFDYQKELFQIQKKLISVADNIYVLADSSKFEKTGLLKLSDIQKEYTYITDSKIGENSLKLYKENDIKIFTGGMN